MNLESKIFVAGHSGMVGTAICEKLNHAGYKNLLIVSSKDLDLTNQKNVFDFFKRNKPHVVINAAARVGGILANNNYPYQFIMENMLIQNNLIHSAHEFEVKKFIFLGSSCIYPKFAAQPIEENSLLSDSLEPTNEWYAIAKISGVKACQAIRKQFNKDYVSLMPTNLYGYNDNFDLDTSHVLPAMIRKFHDAKNNNNSTVILWGSGKPMRDFLFVNDLAEAIIFAIKNKLPEYLYNIGSDSEISIFNLAKMVQKIVGHKGKIIWDLSKPDGTPKKLLDISKIKKLGWRPSTGLEIGINKTYNWFLKNTDSFKQVKL